MNLFKKIALKLKSIFKKQKHEHLNEPSNSENNIANALFSNSAPTLPESEIYSLKNSRHSFEATRTSIDKEERPISLHSVFVDNSKTKNQRNI